MMLQITNEGDNSFIWSPDLWIFRYVALWQCIKIFCILVGKSRQTSSIKEKTKKKAGSPCGSGLCLIILEYQVQLSAEPNTNQFNVQTERGAKALRSRPSYLIMGH